MNSVAYARGLKLTYAEVAWRPAAEAGAMARVRWVLTNDFAHGCRQVQLSLGFRGCLYLVLSPSLPPSLSLSIYLSPSLPLARTRSSPRRTAFIILYLAGCQLRPLNTLRRVGVTISVGCNLICKYRRNRFHVMSVEIGLKK